MSGEFPGRLLGPDEPFEGKDLSLVFGPLHPEIDQEVASVVSDLRSRGYPDREIPKPEMTLDESAALGLAAFYDEGYEGHIPAYEEDQLAYHKEIKEREAGERPSEEQ